MTPERWRRVEALYHSALVRKADERAAFLADACADDEGLRHEVESLLAQPASGEGIFDGPALAVAAQMVTDARASGLTGRRIGVYHVQARVGAGGMGDVYRARDTKLGRDVAIKVLPKAFTSDPDRLARFEREARLLASLNHPNIATIHGIEDGPMTGSAEAGHDDGADVRAIVMELVTGETLATRIARGPLTVDEVLAIARQIADALDAAHERGIVHRDLKPANIAITPDGLVKVLDFGLAKVFGPASDVARGASSDQDAGRGDPSMVSVHNTADGLVVGTAAYMSPEQAQGKTVDGRSDVFSFGVVVYELLTGRAPFAGATIVETLAKILETQAPTLSALRPDVPPRLTSLVDACLDKDRSRRPPSREVHQQLRALELSRSNASVSVGALLRRREVLIPAVIVAVAAIAGGGGWWFQGRDVREARRRVPELRALADRFDYDGFYRAARSVVPLLPDDLQIKQTWLNLTFLADRIDSTPPGADVWVKGYSATTAEWIPIGRTPIEHVRVPFGALRLKVSKNGYAPLEGTPRATYTLDQVALVPEGMVRVPGTVADVHGTTLSMPDYWIDQFEVTNRQFKAFVDAGGYRRREYWTESVVENGRTLTWDETVARFRDKTGRPGPSTWELGTYLDGQANFPVSGVSWYEATAYAAFAGKSLPTAFQWRGAASDIVGFGGLFNDILTESNFGMKGPASAGSHAGLGPYGTYDMAGNVKEWCWNQAAGGRMILGGGWNEPSYRFQDLEAQPALQRGPTHGFRLVKNIASQPLASYAEIRPQTRDYSREKPVDDAAFDILRGLYRYDPTPLNARVESLEDTPDWRRETVTLDAAYGGERVIAYVYLPKSSAPPYQTVVYFPGGDAPNLRSSHDLRLTAVDFVMRSGRALVFPVYKGTYERRVEMTGINSGRDVVIASAKDFGRVIELIDSRPDLDRERIAFYGDSAGTFFGVILTALEPRVKASVLLGSGLPAMALPPEIDLLNFAPRVHVPTLMVSGRGDFLEPVETAQVPLFRLLGTPAEHKRHALFDGGHFPSQLHDLMREILNWFDRYLGPVTPLRPS